MTTMSVTLRWSGSLRAEAQTEDGIPVQINAARNWGEGSAVSPMELLLVSLGSCSALATISILTRLTQGLQQVSVEVSGTLGEGYPKVFKEIEIRYTFVGRGLKPEFVDKALALMEEKYCPVSAMLGKAAQIRHTYRIEEQSTSAA